MAFNPSSHRPGSADKEWDQRRARTRLDDSRPASASGKVRHAEPMDVDDTEGTMFTSQRNSRLKSSSRRTSWHSEDVHGPDSQPGGTKSVSLSDARSTSPATSASEKRVDNSTLNEAAYRLFKASIKQASEKYGPFLPPDDGSPFLALRLHRLWEDLSHEQRQEYYTRASTAENNLDGVDASQKHSRPYSPQFKATSTGYISPPLAAGNATRARFTPYEVPEHHYTSIQTPELRSPVFSADDDPSCGSVRSRSQSPMEDGQSHGSHVPRPPNAWILFRSTMSKSRRPDGVVYSPPEISVMWKNLDSAERDVWFERAKEAKQQHEVANPGYKYRPNRTKSQAVRKPTESYGGGSGSSNRGHRSHPAPSPPHTPWHTRF